MTNTALPLNQRLQVVLDEPTKRLLKAESKRTGESMCDLTREAILLLLERRAQEATR